MATARRAAIAAASAFGVAARDQHVTGNTTARDRKQRGSSDHVTPTGTAMAAEWLLLALALALPPERPLAAEPRKVQIGVRRRPERCGDRSRRGDVLTLHYSGTLEDGTPFDSSLSRDQPFVFSLGTGQVIKGWDQGLLGMCEGEKRKLVIPPELGYGDRGAPPKIPGGAVLIFEVELLKIERRPEL